MLTRRGIVGEAVATRATAAGERRLRPWRPGREGESRGRVKWQGARDVTEEAFRGIAALSRQRRRAGSCVVASACVVPAFTSAYWQRLKTVGLLVGWPTVPGQWAGLATWAAPGKWPRWVFCSVLAFVLFSYLCKFVLIWFSNQTTIKNSGNSYGH